MVKLLGIKDLDFNVMSVQLLKSHAPPNFVTDGDNVGVAEATSLPSRECHADAIFLTGVP